MTERYKNKVDNNNTIEYKKTIHHLRQQIRQLQQQVRQFQEGLNPMLCDSQISIIIDKQTWKRCKRHSKDNDSINEMINRLLDFYIERRKKANFIRQPMQ